MWRRISYQWRDRYRWSFLRQFKMRYPIALAVTVPFISIRDAQGQFCQIDISNGGYASLGIFTILSLGVGFGFWTLYNKTKMQEIDLDLVSKNGWTPYGGEYSPPKAFKIGNVVYLKGVVKDGKNASLIAILPPGWRPVGRRIFCSSQHQFTSARVDVLPDGRIWMACNLSAHKWVSLDEIQFVVD
eukprot:426544_1